jgi:hypothetical protein
MEAIRSLASALIAALTAAELNELSKDTKK